ncbi:cupin domain-containing protein [Pseudomonas xanthosomatis]|uniref:cupin domain-containing protein n=1 Tax=Pseudomonas xanthosomatis TaxID=2842356 RepID=UPI001C3D400B|nr:cupin domain-containing protein [Pseudomonas xanthosomatis]QXH43919.1 cupin domain-containing protein [Pseudomonas xanthosomatis]
MTASDFLKLDEREAAQRLKASDDLFHILFKRGDFSMELFAPRGSDTQQPHAQDEIYVISSGRSSFRRADQVVSVQAGDTLFVPAGVEHRFFDFSDDFRTWVIFFGEQQALNPPR